ncbi:MAG TPA: serine/threonine-protein kinase [Candidatus Obscuribacterales bacterium]
MSACPNCGKVHPGACAAAAQPVGAAQAFLPSGPDGEPHLGQILQGRYEVLSVLGQGGMGTVYMAQDKRLNGRSCVVKQLRDDFYREEDRRKAQAFFQREMNVLSELRHPNIVQIIDFFVEQGEYYLVMEYVQGSNLYAMVVQERQGQPLPERTVIDWVQQVCEVLHYLHTQHPPVIYRDLKPSNIMIDLNNTLKLIDFGIAREYDDKGDHTQVISGGYSPPEQYWGGLDPRSDIYSLGATMHFLLTGKEPEALHVCSPRSINPEVSEKVDALVQRATAQNFNERFQSVEELMEALIHTDYVEAPTSPRSYIGEIVTGVVILSLAVIIFLVEPLLQADTTRNGDATKSVSSSADYVENPLNGAAAAARQQPQIAAGANRTRLAIEITDEKDLTDPEGLSRNYVH